ncbi:ABC transporter substrate-binding protein [Fimbriimonas ginsengisoli]|nr:ABC transporter substrate-binding protein [Fimbriimonas ginsengisoli]
MNARRGSRDLLNAGCGILFLFGLAFGTGWRTQTSAARKGAYPLRVAYFPNLTHAPALVGVAKGFFQKDLPDYDVSTRVVNAGPEAMEALLAGEVDVAYVGPSPATNTFLKTNGQSLTIVAGACSGGASLVARADLPISSVRDLDGHSVAVPQLGGTQDVSCRHFLLQSGLESKEHGGTVSIIPAKNPDILTLFRRKQIDAAWVPEPWASRLRSETGAKTVVDERSLWPNRRFTTTVVVVRRAFADAHPDAVQAFVSSHERTVSWIQGHPAEAQSTVNGELKRLTGKLLGNLVLKEAWGKLDFTTDPNLTSIQALASAAYQAGYLKAAPGTLPGLVDTRALLALKGGK